MRKRESAISLKILALATSAFPLTSSGSSITSDLASNEDGALDSNGSALTSETPQEERSGTASTADSWMRDDASSHDTTSTRSAFSVTAQDGSAFETSDADTAAVPSRSIFLDSLSSSSSNHSNASQDGRRRSALSFGSEVSDMSENAAQDDGPSSGLNTPSTSAAKSESLSEVHAANASSASTHPEEDGDESSPNGKDDDHVEPEPESPRSEAESNPILAIAAGTPLAKLLMATVNDEDLSSVIESSDFDASEAAQQLDEKISLLQTLRQRLSLDKAGLDSLFGTPKHKQPTTSTANTLSPFPAGRPRDIDLLSPRGLDKLANELDSPASESRKPLRTAPLAPLDFVEAQEKVPEELIEAQAREQALEKQVSELKHQLLELQHAYDTLKMESSLEIEKLKHQLALPHEPSQPLPSPKSSSSSSSVPASTTTGRSAPVAAKKAAPLVSKAPTSAPKVSTATLTGVRPVSVSTAVPKAKVASITPRATSTAPKAAAVPAKTTTPAVAPAAKKTSSPGAAAPTKRPNPVASTMSGAAANRVVKPAVTAKASSSSSIARSTAVVPKVAK
jgi:hypothetical protein